MKIIEKKKVSVSEKKVSAPIPIPILILSAEIRRRYRISVVHYFNVKDIGVNKERIKSLHRIPEMKKYKIVAPSLKLLNLKDISSYQTPQFTALIIPYK